MTTVPPSEGPQPDGAPPRAPAGTDAAVAQAGGVGRSAAIMAAGTAASRVLGIVRSALLVAAVGTTGLAADSFDLANKLPNIAVMLLATGVLNAVLVPQVVRAYRTADGEEYVNRVVTLGAALLLGVTVLLTAGAGLLVALYSDTPSGAQLRILATAFALWCLPQVFFYGMYTLLGQVLNARGSFGPYMWAPVVNNVVAIAGLAVFIGLFGPFHGDEAPADLDWWTPARVALLGGTATLGVLCQAAVLVWPLRRIGFRYRPRWRVRGAGLGGAGRVAGWTFAALAVGQVAFLVATQVMTAAPRTGLLEGDPVVAGNAAYTAAFTLYMLPHSLVTVSLLTALFTRLSTHAAADDVDGVRDDFSSGARTIGVFTLFATAALAVLALPVLRLVLPTQSPAEAAVTAPVVVALTAGVAALGTWSLCQRVFYAYEDARSLFWVQVVMAAVVAGGALATRELVGPRHWVTGIAAAMALSHVVGTVLAVVGLRRRLGRLHLARVVRLYVRAGLAAAIAGALGWGIVLAVGALPDDAGAVPLGLGVLRAALVCAVTGLVMLAVYVGLLRLMRVTELADVVAPLQRRLRRRRR